LEGRQIHEAIGVAQEAMHNIKTQKKKGAVLKIDLSKAYDRVSWLYLRILLTHLGFGLPFINWVMSCISSVSFAVLINGVASLSSKPREDFVRDALYPLSFSYWWQRD
jgi:hypothetical protein